MVLRLYLKWKPFIASSKNSAGSCQVFVPEVRLALSLNIVAIKTKNAKEKTPKTNPTKFPPFGRGTKKCSLGIFQSM